ncbi:MAG TPA: TerC family protein, partial [Ramlibacter sp.]|jgi:predicted tellurium resistance membrane protein TerC
VERFPIIIKAGAAVLAFTAAKMIVAEPVLDAVFDPPAAAHAIARWTTYAVCVAGVLGAGWLAARPGRRAAGKPA